MHHLVFASFLAFFLTFPAQAKIFKNAYISFEMQDDWECKQEQIEWVCRATQPEAGKEAVIILTAKEKGPTDSIELYRSHMSSPITTQMKTGASLTSTVKYKPEMKKINDHDWLDGLHQDSEIKNYFTRYVATIKGNIAVLVTFSAHNKSYAKYSSNFDKAIQSFRLAAESDLNRELSMGMGSESFSKNNGMGGLLDEVDSEGGGGKKGWFGLSTEVLLGGALLLLALIAYIVLKLVSKKKDS